MYLFRTLLFLQIVAFMIFCQIVGGDTSTTIIASTTSILESSPSVNESTNSSSTLTLMVATTTEVSTTSTIQPTSASSTAVGAPSSSVAAPTTTPTTTPPPPSGGAQEAVVISIAQMTVDEFEGKRSSFINTLKTVVEKYCAGDVTCTETSRKRRATTVGQVYIASGYPQLQEGSTGVLLVAVFVSTGDTTFLSKNVLLVIVEEFRGNLSNVLGKQITGWGRLHLDFPKTTESTDSSGKNRVLYYFFAGFAGVVLVLAGCIFFTCWIGRKSERQTQNEVRPLTTSNLELVEGNRGGRVNEGLKSD